MTGIREGHDVDLNDIKRRVRSLSSVKPAASLTLTIPDVKMDSCSWREAALSGSVNLPPQCPAYPLPLYSQPNSLNPTLYLLLCRPACATPWPRLPS